MQRLKTAGLFFCCCLGFSPARAWDPSKPFIYEFRIALETDNWTNHYSTTTVLSKSDNAEAFRVVANSTTTPTYQLLVTTQGNMGISTGAPTEKLEVAGTIYSSAGGFKFPDGSTQTAAGVPAPSSAQEGDMLYYTNGAWSRISGPTAAGQSLQYGYDSYTKLLVHADGADGGTAFSDAATGKTVTANGNAQIDTAQYEFGSASALFDGSGDYLTIPDSDDWDLGSGNFTIDFWIRFSVLPASESKYGLFGNYSGGGAGYNAYYRQTSGVYMFHFSNGNYDVYWNYTLALATWYHIAFVRNGGNLDLFVNGVKQTTSAAFAITASAQTFCIGTNGSYDYSHNGWIDEFRLSKSIARWTANFTPPTASYAPAIGWQ